MLRIFKKTFLRILFYKKGPAIAGPGTINTQNESFIP